MAAVQPDSEALPPRLCDFVRLLTVAGLGTVLSSAVDFLSPLEGCCSVASELLLLFVRTL